MPAFRLNKSAPYDGLSDFAKGYIEAMFFTNGDTGDANEQLLNNLGTQRLTRSALHNINAQCDVFLGHIMPDGCFVRQWLDRFEDYSDEQAGRDFWFSRQSHGVGFWDRDELKADNAGEALSKAARSHGPALVEVSKGWIYHD